MGISVYVAYLTAGFAEWGKRERRMAGRVGTDVIGWVRLSHSRRERGDNQSCSLEIL